MLDRTYLHIHNQTFIHTGLQNTHTHTGTGQHRDIGNLTPDSNHAEMKQQEVEGDKKEE